MYRLFALAFIALTIVGGVAFVSNERATTAVFAEK